MLPRTCRELSRTRTKIQGRGDAAASRLSALSCRFHRQADVILSDFGLGRAQSTRPIAGEGGWPGVRGSILHN